MHILIIGAGGREHAIACAVHRSAQKPRITCAPGNAGTAAIAENVKVFADDTEGLLKLARESNVDLTIVGPEVPLCAGIVDRFEAAGLAVLGPCERAARIEGDKAFAKQLLIEAGIPTARGRSFERFADAKEYIATRDTPQVVKAAGLAAGKGVIVCDDPADALLVAERMLVEGLFGDAGRRIVVEEKLIGTELSILALVDGARNIYMLETSQDHKRLGDGDTGPNTGGMGAYSPAPIATPEVLRIIEREILVPTIDALACRDIVYRGVLYCGLMLTPAGPKVLEFNCRFGDPEAQVVLHRLKTDFVEVARACVENRLDSISLEWDPKPAVCVVMASAGYPGSYETRKIVDGLATAEQMDGVRVYHAGTRAAPDNVQTAGGRVLGVTASGDTVAEAREQAYRAVKAIRFDGAVWRTDIAARLGSAAKPAPAQSSAEQPPRQPA